jgi:hypothetical protein
MEEIMVTISRMHKGRRILASGVSRADALRNLERSMRWHNWLGWFSRVPAAVSNLVKPGVAAQFLRRTLGIH